MTKTAAKTKAPSGPKLPEPPSGGRESQAGQYNFWNPTKPGDVMLGTLSGIVEIKNQREELRKRFTLVKDKTLYVLPDHLNLMRMLDDVEKANDGATGVKVWIQYTGKKKVEGVDQPMAFYRVVDYGEDKK